MSSKRWGNNILKERDLDDPATTIKRKKIVHSKSFLNKIYQEWYSLVIENLPAGNEPVLELGSGAGFFQNFYPEAICSEMFFCPHIDLVADGCALPFRQNSLKAIVLIDVLHHIPNPAAFFVESSRCVRPGGKLIMIEPWISFFSEIVYRYLHHESCDPEASSWDFASTGPLSGANSALPWIIFERDRDKFLAEFPGWEIEKIRPFMPLRYLLSGGLTFPALVPAATFSFWKKVEQLMGCFLDYNAMFAEIVAVKN